MEGYFPYLSHILIYTFQPMKLKIYTTILLLFSCMVAFGQKAEGITIRTLLSDGYTETHSAPFTVYHKGRSIYITIPEQVVGREIEIRAQVNKGFDMVARPVGSLGVVRVVKRDSSSIAFQQEICNERIPADHALAASFRKSNVQPGEAHYEILSHDPQKGYLIEITKPLVTGNEWFRYSFSNVRSLETQHCEVTSVLSVGDGFCFNIKRMHEYVLDESKQISYLMVLPGGILPLEIGCLFRLLPPRDIPLRLATYRNVPYTIPFIDYDQDPYMAVSDSLLVRWDMTLSSKEAQKYGKTLTTPTRPIVFYIDSLVPREYRSAIRNAVLSWNKVFAPAGFKDVLQVRDAGKKTILAEQRAVIAYDLIQPGVEGSITYHPRTGEILSCRINIGHGFLGERLDDYLLKHALTDPEIIRDNQNKRRAMRLLEQEVAQKVGEVLGAYTHEGLHRTYRIYPDVKDIYADREAGLRMWGREKSDKPTESLATQSRKLADLSLVIRQLEKFVSVRSTTEKARRLSTLYPKGYKLYGSYMKDLITYTSPTRSDIPRIIALVGDYLFVDEDPMDSPFMRVHSMTDPRWVHESVLRDLCRALLGRTDDSVFALELFSAVHSRLFSNFSSRVVPSVHRMDVQLIFLTTLHEMSRGAKSEDVSLFLHTQLERLMACLKEYISRADADPDTSTYYKFLLFKLGDHSCI